MKLTTNIFLATVLLLTTSNVHGKNNLNKTTKPDSIVIGKVEKVVGNLTFTEGPAVDKEGNLYFTDIPNQLILIWTVENTLDTFRTNSGRANGLFFDEDENLLACEGEKGQVSLTSPNTDYVILANNYKGKRFNQPNDLWSDPKGGVYFTDPKYGKDQDSLPQGGMHVYYIKPDHSSIIRVCDDFEKPNGVIGTPDGKTLYISDANGGFIYKYDIQDDGSLLNKSLFVELGSDGMTIDILGNIYVTPLKNSNIEIYSPSGDLLKSIEIPERPTNVCFGRKDKNYLYITARTSVYGVKINTEGVYK